MDNLAVMMLPPGSVSDGDKQALREAGVIVVEIEDPTSVRFMGAGSELPTSDMLMCAGQAISGAGDYAQQLFGKAISHHLRSHRDAPKDIK